MDHASDLVQRVVTHFEELDRATARYGGAVGISCPPGCGRCCQNPQIEATVLDMIPVARELLRDADGNAIDEIYQRALAEESCIFFKQDAHDRSKGRCGIYPLRPSLCRLFGFAPRSGKHGAMEHVGCGVHKEMDPGINARAEAYLRTKPQVADYQTSAQRLASIQPNLAESRGPLNKKLAEALDYLGLQMTLSK